MASTAKYLKGWGSPETGRSYAKGI